MLSIVSGVAGPILVGFVAAGLLACVGELIVVVFLSGSRPAGVAGFAGLGCPVSVTSLGLAIFVLSLPINFLAWGLLQLRRWAGIYVGIGSC